MLFTFGDKLKPSEKGLREYHSIRRWDLNGKECGELVSFVRFTSYMYFSLDLKKNEIAMSVTFLDIAFHPLGSHKEIKRFYWVKQRDVAVH